MGSIIKKEVMLEKISQISLGDRTNPQISIKGNTITMKTEEFTPPYETQASKYIIDLEGKNNIK